jgi:hypothetical protein
MLRDAEKLAVSFVTGTGLAIFAGAVAGATGAFAGAASAVADNNIMLTTVVPIHPSSEYRFLTVFNILTRPKIKYI